MQSYEGYFENGDQWNGHSISEEPGPTWYCAIDSLGREYETEEEPKRYPLFTMTRFDEGAPEKEVKEFFNGQT